MKICYNKDSACLIIMADDEKDSFNLGVMYGKGRTAKINMVANCEEQHNKLPKVTIKVAKYQKP